MQNASSLCFLLVRMTNSGGELVSTGQVKLRLRVVVGQRAT